MQQTRIFVVDILCGRLVLFTDSSVGPSGSILVTISFLFYLCWFQRLSVGAQYLSIAIVENSWFCVDDKIFLLIPVNTCESLTLCGCPILPGNNY